MAQKPTPIQPQLDQRLVRALGHPIRVAALELLSEEVLSPNQMKDRVGAGLSHTSYHVRALEKCEAVELIDTKQRRGATEHFYKASARAFIGSPDWRRVPKTFLGTVAGASLGSLIGKAIKALEAGSFDKPAAVLTWMPVMVDDKGAEEIEHICEATNREVAEVEQRSKRRLAESGDSRGTPYIVGMAGFEAAGEG